MCNQKLFSAPVLQAEQTMLHPPLCKCVYRPYTSLPVLIHVLSAFNFIWEIGSTPKLPSYPGSSPTLIPRFLLYKRLLPYPRTQAPPLPSYPGSSPTLVPRFLLYRRSLGTRLPQKLWSDGPEGLSLEYFGPGKIGPGPKFRAMSRDHFWSIYTYPFSTNVGLDFWY